VTDEKLATLSRSRWYRIRTITYWTFTVLLVFELAAGSLWNLLQIEWVRVQLNHLGYPLYITYILGVWKIGGAAVIISPRFPRLKEWAYAGSFFQFSGAVASHLSAGDGVESWWVPLMFATCAIASWVLRPADRRLPETRLGRDRPAHAGQDRAGPPETRPRAWAVPIVLLVVLYAVSFLSLPAVEEPLHDRAVELGWIDE
jgi:hypothetical protein